MVCGDDGLAARAVGSANLLRLVAVLHLQPLLHAAAFDGVAALLQVDEARILLVLVAQEELRQLFEIADAAKRRALVAAIADAFVAAFQRLLAGLGAWRHIADFAALLRASYVRASSRARFRALGARLTALLRAFAVLALVDAVLLAGSARLPARGRALVAAGQHGAALLHARYVHSALVAFSASAAARVVALQFGAARLRAMLEHFQVLRSYRKNKSCITL